MSITRNIAARDAYTQRLLSATPKVTYADCRDLSARIVAERGEDEADALLTRFGCRSIRDLLPECVDEFYHYGCIVLLRGVSPTYAWSLHNSVPDHLRDRWLLVHHGSGCLWEVRGKRGPVDLRWLTGGGAMDVSGVPRWEEEFRLRPGMQITREEL